MKNREVTKSEIIAYTIKRGIAYNAIEAALIVLFSLMLLIKGALWMPVVWAAFAAAAVWVVITSSSDSQYEARRLVLHGELYISDFIAGAVFMLVLASLTVHAGIQFGIIFLVAAIQNIRYTALSIEWAVEKRDERQREE